MCREHDAFRQVRQIMYVYTGFGRKTWRFLSYNKMKSILIVLREFITKIIFISKHFNYSIHFLNMVSVRWRPLLSAHFRKRRTSDENLTQSFDVPRSSKWRLSFWRFPFCSRRCFSAVSHPQQYSMATRDTVVPMSIEVPTKYPLSPLKYVSTAKARCFTDQCSMAAEMLWVSLEGHSRTNSPRQRFHSQLCCQIVRYFCQPCIWVEL